MSDVDLRDTFLASLNHIENVFTKVSAHSGPTEVLGESELHTLAEGLFLSAFTHWEQFTRNLLVEDLATNPASAIHRSIQMFSDPEAPRRFAVMLLQHPDHPRKFIEWSSYAEVVARANEFLGAGNRFASTPLPRSNDLRKLKSVRNAIAHRSDKAWSDFLQLCEDPPFNILAAQMIDITPGRFLIAHNLNGHPILRYTIALLKASAQHLVP